MEKKNGALDISAADESKTKSVEENGSSKIQLASEVKTGSSPTASESSSLYVVAVLGCLVIAALSFAAGVLTPPAISFKDAYDSQQR